MNRKTNKAIYDLLDHLIMLGNNMQTCKTNIIPFKRIRPKERVAFYSRGMTMEAVTKDHQAFSIRCRQRHYRQGEAYLDFDWTPAKPRRPAFARMLADAHDHKFDVLTVPSFDRISRDMNELICVIAELETQDIRIALMKDDPEPTIQLTDKPNRKASA